MKEINMKLRGEPFDLIKGGKKTVELRLYDEKRRQIEEGDIICFACEDCRDEKIFVRVSCLYKSDSFFNLFLIDGMLTDSGFGGYTPHDAALAMRRYYTEENEEKYGVVGIGFSVLN